MDDLDVELAMLEGQLVPSTAYPSANMSTPALMNLRYLRPTSLQTFEECPHTWALQTLTGVQQKPNKYAEMGTACHSAIETYLRMRNNERTYDQFVSAYSDAKACMERNDHEHEVENLLGYIAKLESVLDSGYRILAIEHKFSIGMFEGMPLIAGTIDLILWSPTGVVVIWDHKTSRGYEPSDVWSNKLQPMIYSWAVRRIWPTAREYRFHLGYINIDVTHPEWIVTDEQEQATARRVWAAWENMKIFAREVNWPQTFGTACGFCPIQKSCSTMKASISDLKNSFLKIVQEQDPIDQLVWITAVEKAAKTYKEETQQRLMIDIAEAGGRMIRDGQEWYVEHSVRRKATYSDVYEAIASTLGDWDITTTEGKMLHDEEMQRFVDMYDDLFSAKVGGIDKLAKAAPILGKAVKSVIVDITSDKPSIKNKKHVPQITQ